MLKQVHDELLRFRNKHSLSLHGTCPEACTNEPALKCSCSGVLFGVSCWAPVRASVKGHPELDPGSGLNQYSELIIESETHSKTNLADSRAILYSDSVTGSTIPGYREETA